MIDWENWNKNKNIPMHLTVRCPNCNNLQIFEDPDNFERSKYNEWQREEDVIVNCGRCNNEMNVHVVWNIERISLSNKENL